MDSWDGFIACSCIIPIVLLACAVEVKLSGMQAFKEWWKKYTGWY